jgi:pimeloyl-ACP methyl ester carboxylesterase
MRMRHGTVATAGQRLHVVIAGEGPLVLLAHGFPELGHSWRHQIEPLAAAGYQVVVPDMRGYGGSTAPAEIDEYTILHLVGDMVGLVRALGEEQAHIVGHDWGAAVAWHAALLRPEVFPTVVGVSVPFQPRNADRRPIPSLIEIGQRKQLGEFYMVRFQEPGLAEAEFEADIDRTLLLMAHSRFTPFLTPGKPILPDGPDPDGPPGWTSAADLAVYVDAFRASGFRGPLNYYRNLDRNWELTAAWQGAKITQPALYITGEQDHVRVWSGNAEAKLHEMVPRLTDTVIVPGAGHWVQQQEPEAVTGAILGFLDKHGQ